MTVGQLDIALAHAALGRRVFPFRLVPRPDGGFDKRPLVKWKEAASADPDTIRKWARSFRTAHWGWVLPEGLLVADVDDRDSFSGWLADNDPGFLEYADPPFQETPSGGVHLLFTGDGRQTVKEVPGLDTRVGGKGWVGLYALDAFAGDPPPAPEWLLMERPASEWAEPSEDEPITSRQGILELVGRLRWASLSESEILAALLERYGDGRITESDSSRPWTRADFAAIASEFGRKPTGGSAPGITVRFVRHTGVEEAEEGDYSFPLSAVEEKDPPDLLLGRLDPMDHTILFGTGGTGKGVLAAWWAARLVREAGIGVMVIDYEEHTRYEWRPRVRRFAGPDAEKVLGAVRVVQPRGRPLWTEVPRIRAEIDRIAEDPELLDVGYVIIDSVTYAVGDLEAEKSGTATKYSKALSALAMPVLSLAHTTKSDADPRYPFGSVYWHNGARVTMSLVGEGPEPRVLTQKKTNQRALFEAVSIDWSWTETGTEPPEKLEEHGVQLTWAERFLEIIGADSLTVAEVVARMHDRGWKTSEENLRGALNRDMRHASSHIRSEKVDGMLRYHRWPRVRMLREHA